MLLRHIVLRCMVIVSIELLKAWASVSSNHTFDPGEDDKSVDNLHYDADEKLLDLDLDTKYKRLSKTLSQLNGPGDLGLDGDALSGSVPANLNLHTSFSSSNGAVDVAEHSGNGDLHIIDDSDYPQGVSSYGSGASEDTSLEDPRELGGHAENTNDLALGPSSDDLDFEAWRRKIGAEDSVPIVPEDDFGVNFATKILFTPTSPLPQTPLDVITTKNVLIKSSLNFSRSTSLPLTTVDKPNTVLSRNAPHHRNEDILTKSRDPPHIGFRDMTTTSGRHHQTTKMAAGREGVRVGKDGSSSASKMSFKLYAVIRFCLVLCTIFQFYRF